MRSNTRAVAIISTEHENHGILRPEVTGIGQAIQAFQVQVTEAGQQPIQHLVVMAYYPELDRTLCDKLAICLCQHYGEVFVSFIVNDDPGQANVYMPPTQRSQCSMFSVATAVSVVKRSCGWDESDEIRISCETTGTVIELSPESELYGRWVIE